MLESKFIQDVLAKAKQHYKTIVLPEGEDLRVLKAAHLINKDKICKIILLGDEKRIKDDFAQNGWDINGIEIIKPETSPKLKEYANLLFELRKNKGMTEEEAFKTAQNYNYFGTLMIKSGDADGMVSGANHSTADTVRPALQIIKSANKDRGVSSFWSWSPKTNPMFLPTAPSPLTRRPKSLPTLRSKVPFPPFVSALSPKLPC